MKFQGFIVAVALLFGAAAAQAQTVTAFANGSSYLHAGPGADFPVVAHIPPGADIAVMGCTQGFIWCDVAWNGNRGWLASKFLDATFNEEHVSLRTVNVPVVVFDRDSYWQRFYRSYPFYSARAWLSGPGETPAEVRRLRYTGVDE